MYKLIMNPLTNTISAICKIDAELFIPINSDNADYQAYLAWLAEGNTPSSPDEAVSE